MNRALVFFGTNESLVLILTWHVGTSLSLLGLLGLSGLSELDVRFFSLTPQHVLGLHFSGGHISAQLLKLFIDPSISSCGEIQDIIFQDLQNENEKQKHSCLKLNKVLLSCMSCSFG